MVAFIAYFVAVRPVPCMVTKSDMKVETAEFMAFETGCNSGNLRVPTPTLQVCTR